MAINFKPINAVPVTEELADGDMLLVNSGGTAKQWAKVLQSMGIVTLLEPYAANELKRLVKSPKLYFCDTDYP